jgi:hypothetical protein
MTVDIAINPKAARHSVRLEKKLIDYHAHEKEVIGIMYQAQLALADAENPAEVQQVRNWVKRTLRYNPVYRHNKIHGYLKSDWSNVVKAD